jgi:hypothetical protein
MLLGSLKDLTEKIVGIDKDGIIFSVDKDGTNFRQYINGQWVFGSGNYENTNTPIIRINNQGRWILAIGSEQIDLGTAGIPQGDGSFIVLTPGIQQAVLTGQSHWICVQD